MNKRNRFLAILPVTLAFALCAPQLVIAQSTDIDWLVTLNTQVLKGMLTFNGSKNHDPVKVHVDYLETVKGENAKVSYEDFWYNSLGKPIGQEKFTTYNIRPAEQIVLRVTHKTSNPENKEFTAAANAALRFYTDSRNHKGVITAIRVPFDSFNGIEAALEQLNFIPYEIQAETGSSDVKVPTLLLTSEPPGKAQNLKYNR